MADDTYRRDQDDRTARRGRDDGIERWMGGMEANQATQSSNIATLFVAVETERGRITDLQIQVATLRTQIGVWSALGGLAGAGIVSLVVSLVTK